MNTIGEADIKRFTRVAVDLACSGAALARSMMGSTTTTLKSDRSPVTDADVRVQDMIVHRLRQSFPTHGVLAEETSALLTDPETAREFLWAIDPIDGTRNFAAGIPNFTCSVALMHRGRPVVGAVVMPEPKMIFHANILEPARLNHSVISVSDRPLDDSTVIAPSVSHAGGTPPYMRNWLGTRVIRDFGTLAWHLGLTAAGKIDAVVNLNGKLWDIAAGALLVERAGGRIISLDSSGHPIKDPIWPIDQEGYHRQVIRLLACSNAVADALTEEMAG